MKTRQWLLVCFLLLSFAGCKKDAESRTALEGTWELKSETNGMKGGITQYPPNNGNLVVFSGSRYQTFFNKQLVKSGSFKIVEEMRNLTNSKGNRIIYDNDSDQVRTFFNVSDNGLEMFVDAFDGPGTLYIKKE